MKKILIVDDDDFIKELESKKFSSLNYDVQTASSAEQAYAYLKENTPDVILLDLMLPGVDGFAILEEIRKEEKNKNIPILAFSNLSSDEDMNRVKTLGATEFIVKSNYTLDEVAEKIASIIGK